MADDGDPSSRQDVLSRVREYQRTLEAISRIGPEAVSPERLMRHVTAQVARVTHIGHTKIMRYRPDKGDLLVEAGIGWKDHVVGQATLAVDYRSPAGRSIQTGAPVYIRDVREAPEYRMPELLRDHGIVSFANVPIMINGRTWGVLEVDSTKPFTFDEWDTGFLSTLANIMGISLGLHESKQQYVEVIADVARERARFDMTIRELQHRIKNNLQIIVAFLTMKVRELPEEYHESLDAVVNRIQAVALAHDLLSGAKKAGGVDFADYLNSLCGNLDPQRPDLAIEVTADSVAIPIDRAVPAGLVVNELVTNAIKYAFGNDGGRIRVHFSMVANASEACVAVEDDGKGMELPPKKGRGLTLVEGFAAQIQGRVDYVKVDAGSRTVLCFPVAV